MTHANLYIRLTALLCITALEITAMLKGVDGAAFGLAVAAIGAIVGTTLKPITQIFKTTKPPES